MNLNVLLRQKKDVERELHERLTSEAASAEEGKQLEAKHAVLERGISLKTDEIALTEAMASEVREAVCETSQTSICRLMVELETGGNIRLEDGKPTDVWCARKSSIKAACAMQRLRVAVAVRLCPRDARALCARFGDLCGRCGRSTFYFLPYTRVRVGRGGPLLGATRATA